MSFALYMTTSFALIFVIEGLFYALFPNGAKKILALALVLPTQKLRALGTLMVLTGFFILLFLQHFSGS